MGALRQANIREKEGPSLGQIQVKIPHRRSPYALKFEDRSQEETERQQRCARSKAWNPAINKYKLKEKDKTTLHSPAEARVLPAASTKELEEREFVEDIEKSYDGDAGQRRGANQRRSHGICQRIGQVRDGYAS